MAGATRLAIAAAAALLAACHQRPSDIVVICHNANCAGTDPAEDDTPEALAASLALVGRDGTAPIDGVEVDLSWSRATSTCVFAHALGRDIPTAPAEVAAALIADHLRLATPRGDRFHVMIELKRGVDDASSRHDADERAAHAGCAIAAFETIRAAAADAGEPINVLFESFEPDLLEALIAHPAWPGQRRDAAVEIRLAASFSTPSPLGYSETLPAFAGVSLDVVDVHPRWTSPGEYAAFASLDLQVSLWTASVTSELLDALDSFEPTYVVTSEALLLRNWLDR
jgi:hypothetical protein